jgi:ATP-dependent Zn protease
MGILSTLLTEIDGFGGDSSISRNKPILIVGATNRPEHIDDALLRPGRFDKLIHVPAPDILARSQILTLLLQKMPIDANVDIETLAKRTQNFSGADLVNLCNEAALHAATRDINCEVISRDDFENVLTFLRSSLCEEKIRFYEKFERQRGGAEKAGVK